MFIRDYLNLALGLLFFLFLVAEHESCPSVCFDKINTFNKWKGICIFPSVASSAGCELSSFTRSWESHTTHDSRKQYPSIPLAHSGRQASVSPWYEAQYDVSASTTEWVSMTSQFKAFQSALLKPQHQSVSSEMKCLILLTPSGGWEVVPPLIYLASLCFTSAQSAFIIHAFQWEGWNDVTWKQSSTMYSAVGVGKKLSTHGIYANVCELMHCTAFS